MTSLEAIIPRPRLVELDSVDVAATPSVVWERVRHADIADSRLVRALFAIRTLPARVTGRGSADALRLRSRIDDFVSTPSQPGFQLLAEDPPHELVVGAIGKVWQLDIPFVHVADAAAYAAFSGPDYVKVAWAFQIEPIRNGATRVSFEVRVDATDETSWRRFRRYFRVIGIGSHFIRHTMLAALGREFGSPVEGTQAACTSS